MAYEALTPAKFKELKPQFADVSDPVVQSYIDLASMWVDETWPEKAYQPAWAAMTCHLMTLDGLGTDAESQGQSSGAAQYHSIKSGELTLTRYQKDAGDMSYSDWLAQTKCGQFFLQLLKMGKGGPRVAMGGINAGCVSPYAKDWPSWWQGAGF